MACWKHDWTTVETLPRDIDVSLRWYVLVPLVFAACATVSGINIVQPAHPFWMPMFVISLTLAMVSFVLGFITMMERYDHRYTSHPTDPYRKLLAFVLPPRRDRVCLKCNRVTLTATKYQAKLTAANLAEQQAKEIKRKADAEREEKAKALYQKRLAMFKASRC